MVGRPKTSDGDRQVDRGSRKATGKSTSDSESEAWRAAAEARRRQEAEAKANTAEAKAGPKHLSAGGGGKRSEMGRERESGAKTKIRFAAGEKGQTADDTQRQPPMPTTRPPHAPSPRALTTYPSHAPSTRALTTRPRHAPSTTPAARRTACAAAVRRSLQCAAPQQTARARGGTGNNNLSGGPCRTACAAPLGTNSAVVATATAALLIPSES